MRLIIHCDRRLSFSREEIVDLVDDSAMAAIKAVDPQPVIQGYIAFAEGEAHPRVFTETSAEPAVLQVTRGAVASFVDSIRSKISRSREAVPLHVNHAEARNSTEATQASRPPVAYVAGARTVRAHGKLCAAIAAYFPPETRAHAGKYGSVSGEFDFASSEQPSPGGVVRYIVDKVADVFGIALLTDDAEPAVAEARSLGVAYASYSPEAGKENENMSMDMSQVPFENLVAEVRRRRTHPHQIFSESELMGQRVKLEDGSSQWIGGDRTVNGLAGKLIDEEVRRAMEGADANSAKKSEEFEATKKDLESALAEVAQLKLGPMIQAKADELKLPAGLVARIKRKSGQIRPGEDLEKTVDEFISAEKEVYDEDMKDLGGTESRKEPSPPAEGGAPNLGGSDGEGSSGKGFFGVDDVPEEFQ